MGSLFGGGGGGSAPVAPKLKQVDTSLTGPLYQQSAAMGDQWANLMRGSYGLGQSTGAPSWEAKYLGPGALAMMGQAALPFAGKQDPQTQAALTTGFGAPSFQGAGGAFGGGGAGSTWNLGSDPYQMARELGQKPEQQLQRAQGFESALLKQWPPPQLRLTGEDLLSVKRQQDIQNAQAQQAAYEAALQSSSYAASAQAQAQGAETQALGQLGGAGIKAFTSPSLSSTGYTQTPLGLAFNPGSTPGGTGGGGFFGADYSSPPSDVSPGGGLVSNAGTGSGG
jgi:hypothetical protein